ASSARARRARVSMIPRRPRSTLFPYTTLFRSVVWMTPAVESDPWIGNPNIRYLFVTYPNYYQEAKVLTRYAVEELGLRRIAVIYQNDQYGDNGRRGVIDALAEMGMEPVAAVPYELTDADLSVQALLIGQAQA